MLHLHCTTVALALILCTCLERAGASDEPVVLYAQATVRHFVVSQDGKEMITADIRREIVLWDLTQPAKVSTAKIHDSIQPYLLSSIHRGKSVLAAASVIGPPADESPIYLVDFDKKTVGHRLTVSGKAMSFWKDKTVATVPAKEPTLVHCYDINTAKKTSLTARGKRIVQVEFAPDGSYLVALGILDSTISQRRRGVLSAWDWPSAKKRWEIETQSRIDRFFLTPDGKKLLAPHIPTTSVWDTVTGRNLVKEEFLMPRAIHPDGKHVVEADTNAWMLKTISPVTEVARLKTERAASSFKLVQFTTNGLMIGAGNGGEIWIWKTPKLDKTQP